MRFYSYAQEYEDLILYVVLKNADKIFYIDVGANEGEMELVCAGTGSTFSMETVQEGEFAHCSRHKKKILTLTQIYKQYCIESQQIHFCKVDVEGFEKEVLQGCDFNVFRPWIFVVEAMKPGTTIPCHEEWENILLDNGYILGYKKGINRYYVDSRKEHLLEKFQDIEKFMAENEIVKMEMVRK